MPSTNLPATLIRLVVAADVRLYCEGLAAVLPRERLLVVGTANSRDAAAAIAQSLQPDVVLVDVALTEALNLMRQLRVDAPAIQLIAFGVGEDISTIVECAEAGAVAYVPAGAGVEELVIAIEGAAGGELRCSPRIAGELFRRAGERGRAAPHAANFSEGPALTGRQSQVLAMLRQSLSNKEIAVAMKISEATVKNHVHNLLDKLQVPNRVKAAACLPRPNRATVRSRLTPASPLGPAANCV